MKIYPAISFRDTLEKGGSTQPWVVDLLTDEGIPTAFVVKMFNSKQVRQQNAIAKEVYGNILARALGLPVPDYALAKFTPDFLATLSDKEKERNNSCHQGLRFASKYFEGYTTFGDNLLNSKIQDYDLASVYAFDNLIWNIDRGGYRDKPNLIINDEDCLLIDHELIFPFADDPDEPNYRVIDDFKANIWSYRYEKHLFYPYLKSMRSTQKRNRFSCDSLNL